MTTMTKRIGFACKYIDNPSQVNGIKPKDDCKRYNLNTTTVAWCRAQERKVAKDRLWLILQQNLEATRLLIEKVSTFEPEKRMLRIGSDVLPLYTHEEWRNFWQTAKVQDYCYEHFDRIGDLARREDVRLSFHPGHFCVLASDNPRIVTSSIQEFEYHADMARMMGYGKKFQDLKINVHLSGKGKAATFRETFAKLSQTAKNCITIENDEMQSGLDECLEISDLCPIVLDIHHHFIRTGEYIKPDDPRIKQVVRSWRKVRPTIHYSISREDVLFDHSKSRLPNLEKLLTLGYKKQQLRAHSDFMWNRASNKWALEHLAWADIMVEAKAKNLASTKLHNYAVTQNFI